MLRRAGIGLVAILCVGCSAGPRTEGGAGTVGEVLLRDGFEDRRWAQDSAGDHAALSVVAMPGVEGSGALAVEFADNGRGHAIVRREADDDYSRASELRLDVFLAAGRPEVALAFRAAGRVYETRAVPLSPGWNRDLAFRLDAAGMAEGTDVAAWTRDRAAIDRLLVHLVPRGERGRVVLDRLRVVAAGGVRRSAPPTMDAVRPPTAPVAPWAVAEIACVLRWPPAPVASAAPRATPQLARMTALTAHVRAPDGRVLDVPGFCAGPAEGGGWEYRVRIAPDRAGDWTWQLVAGDGADTVVSPVGTLVCSGEPGALTPAVVDPRDPRWFSDARGAFLYPIGTNLAWAGDYEPWLAELGGAGATWVRTWTCPWNHPLDVGGRWETVDFASAAAFDRMFARAAAHGVRVQFVLMYHGMLAGDWAKSPFNAANGGPCRDPRDFWRDPRARDLFRRYLDYAVARWGADPALFAWELINEADLCPRWIDEDVIDWHRAMARHLATRDPWRRPVTTSTASAAALPALWRIEGIACANPHAYTPDAARAIAEAAALAPPAPGPVLLAEYGRGWEPRDDLVDPEGRLFRHALWLGWLSDLAGTPMPWWWDTHLQPNGLSRHLATFAAFVRGEDRRGRRFAAVETPATAGGPALRALVAADLVYGYAYDPVLIAAPARQPLAPLLGGTSTLTLRGVAPGAWRVRWTDPVSGRVADGGEATADADGTLVLRPGAAGEAVAFVLRRRAAALAAEVAP